MKKLLLGLGSIIMIGTPIIVVVSCSDDPTPPPPSEIKFSYEYKGTHYTDGGEDPALRDFGHAFRNSLATDDLMGIYANEDEYKEKLTQPNVDEITILQDGNPANVVKVMEKVAEIVKLPANIQTIFTKYLNDYFPAP